jgi:TIR domain/inactive STAND
MSHEVFISYSSPDRAVADAVCAALEAAGVSCWIAPRNIPPTEDYTEKIPRAIDQARLMVLIFSAKANSSRHVKTEVDLAFNKPVPILPFRIENVFPSEGMKYLLNHSQWLDAFSPSPAANLQRLVTETRRHLAQLPATPGHDPEAQPRPTAAQSVSNFGPLVHKLCDRISQENAFNKFFKTHSKNDPGRPQIYFLQGQHGECHDSFVERLMHTQIRLIAEKRWGEQHSVITHKQPAWPHEGEFAELQQDLKINLFKEFDPAYAEDELSATALRKLVAGVLCPLVVIQHNIYAQHWSARTRQLVEWYLGYWDEIKANTDGPQFVVFFSIIYPDKNAKLGKTRVWWKPWAATESFEKGRVQVELAEIVSSSQQAGRLCFLLKELMPPKQFEVQDWFSHYHIYDEQTQREKLAALFPAQVEELSMSQIQQALKKIHEEFVSERGYF